MTPERLAELRKMAEPVEDGPIDVVLANDELRELLLVYDIYGVAWRTRAKLHPAVNLTWTT